MELSENGGSPQKKNMGFNTQTFQLLDDLGSPKSPLLLETSTRRRSHDLHDTMFFFYSSDIRSLCRYLTLGVTQTSAVSKRECTRWSVNSGKRHRGSSKFIRRYCQHVYPENCNVYVKIRSNMGIWTAAKPKLASSV